MFQFIAAKKNHLKLKMIIFIKKLNEHNDYQNQ
jgi:hypothetical protein